MNLKLLLKASIVFIPALIFSCTQGKKSTKQIYEISQKNLYKAIKDTSVIITKEENVREVPNGEILGKTMKNERFDIVDKRINWVKIKNDDFPVGYIWAPSLGFEKINAYALNTWFDQEVKGFYQLQQYLNLMGNPSEETDFFGLERMNFFNVGFGREKEIMMDQEGKSQELTKLKGVGLVLYENRAVKEIHLDLRKELNSYKEVQALMDVELGTPNEVEATHVSWFNQFGIPEIQLNRTEFEKDKFNQLILIF